MTRLERYAVSLAEALEQRLVPVEGGPMDGTRILTDADISEAFRDTLQPPVDEHTAELATPATVYLDAKCHICGQTARVVVNLESKTTVDDKRRVIAAKVDGGSVDHLCGQMTLLDVTDTADGQMDWTIPSVEDCPFPECVLPTEHEGPHMDIEQAQAADGGAPG